MTITPETYSTVIHISFPLGFCAGAGVFGFVLAAGKYPRLKRFVPIPMAICAAAILTTLAMRLLFEQSLWGQFRTIPIDQATGATITISGKRIQLSSTAAWGFHHAIAVAEHVPAHHSHPVKEFRLEFFASVGVSYVYTIGPDSEHTHEYWIDDASGRRPSPGSYIMGRIVSEELTSLIENALEQDFESTRGVDGS